MEHPKYVRLNNTSLRLAGKEYFRDVGQWGVNFKINKFGKLISTGHYFKYLNNVELIEITKEEYFKDNEGHVPVNVF